MKTQTNEKYKIFFIILTIAILGIFAFFAAQNLLSENPGENENQEAGEKTPSAGILQNSSSTDGADNPHDTADSVDFPGITPSANEDEDEKKQEQTEPSAEPDPEPVKPAEEVRITFTGAGDNVVHECLWMDARNRALPDGRAYNFKPMFADVAAMIAEADIAFINQETPMAGSDFALSGYPTFNSPQELGHDLVELGFDVINIAHNHMIDKGERGLVNMINFLRSLDTMPIGDYLNRDELYNIKVIERGGIKIAFLAYTYGTNGITLPASAEVFIPYINDELIISQIAKAKEVSDTVIVSIHWGEENIFTPTARQRQLAQLMADHEVLAIIGHHPHVLQPIEWLEGSGGNRTLCVYSLGNLASGMAAPMNMVGGFIGFDIVMSNGEVALENPIFTPTIYYYGRGWLNGHIYLLEEYTPELARSHGTHTRHGYTHSVNDLWKYVTNHIDAQFLKNMLTNN